MSWMQLDEHIAKSELLNKIAIKRCLLLKNEGMIIGVMRYNLMYDEIPFLTQINIETGNRGKGFGKQALLWWENQMRSMGYPCVMTSTRSDEEAQFFYRKLGYKDTGCLLLDVPALAQPTELFFIKELGQEQ